VVASSALVSVSTAAGFVLSCVLSPA